MDRLLVLLALLSAASAHATPGDLACSVRPPAGTARVAYADLANLSEPEAENAALATVGDPSPLVEEHALEVDRGCLVYVFDVHVRQDLGVDEILVDAGNGKVLRREHETAEQEAARHEAFERDAAPDPTP